MMQKMNSSSIKLKKIIGILLASVVLALVISQVEARSITDEDGSIVNRHVDERPHVLDKRASDKDSSTSTTAPKDRKKKTKRPKTTTTQSPDDDDDPTKGPKPARKSSGSTTTKVPDSKSTTGKPSSSTTKPDAGKTTTTGKPNSGTSTTKKSTTRSDDKDFDDLMHRQREEKIALEHLNAGLLAWKRALEKNDRVLNRIEAGEFFKNLISLRKVIRKSDVVAMIREYMAFNNFTSKKPWLPRKVVGDDEGYNDDKPESLDY